MRSILMVIALLMAGCDVSPTCIIRETPPLSGGVVGLPNGPTTVKQRNPQPWIPNQYVPAPAQTRCS